MAKETYNFKEPTNRSHPVVRILTSNNDNVAANKGAGGIQVVLTAMMARIGHVGVKEYGCQTLHKLGSKNDNDVKCLVQQYVSLLLFVWEQCRCLILWKFV